MVYLFQTNTHTHASHPGTHTLVSQIYCVRVRHVYGRVEGNLEHFRTINTRVAKARSRVDRSCLNKYRNSFHTPTHRVADGNVSHFIRIRLPFIVAAR